MKIHTAYINSKRSQECKKPLAKLSVSLQLLAKKQKAARAATRSGDRMAARTSERSSKRTCERAIGRTRRRSNILLGDSGPASGLSQKPKISDFFSAKKGVSGTDTNYTDEFLENVWAKTSANISGQNISGLDTPLFSTKKTPWGTPAEPPK